jgi:hypothetical protein
MLKSVLGGWNFMNKKKFLLIVILVSSILIIFLNFNGDKIHSCEYNNEVCEFEIMEGFDISFFDLYSINTSFGQSAYGLASADFNEDGWMDFVVSYATRPFNYSTVSLFINKGNLSFEQQDLFSLNYSYIKDLDAGDFDGDGDIDLLFSFDEYRWYDDLPFNMNGTLVLAMNNGNNDFSNLSLIHQWTSEDNMDPNLRINLQITSADYDNDGDLDIIIGDNSGKVELLLNYGNASFYSMGVIGDFGSISWGVTSFDVNDDEYMDIIVAAATDDALHSPLGYLYCVPNNGKLNCDNMEYSVVGNITLGIGTGYLSSINVDDDADKEIIAGIVEKIYLFDNEDGKYIPTSLYESPTIEDRLFKDLSKGGMTVGDFNNDGYDDFITGGVQGNIRLFLNNYQEH